MKIALFNRLKVFEGRMHERINNKNYCTNNFLADVFFFSKEKKTGKREKKENFCTKFCENSAGT